MTIGLLFALRKRKGLCCEGGGDGYAFFIVFAIIFAIIFEEKDEGKD